MSRRSEEIPRVNSIFLGEVANVMSYGAFIQIPGVRKQGLVHKTQICNGQVDDVGDVLQKRDRVWCKVIGVGESGYRIALSMKVVDQGSGKDQDPNGVQISLDEKRRKAYNQIRQERKIHLGAIFNTVCRKCGTQGHLAQDCFQVRGKVYKLLPEEDTSRNEKYAADSQSYAETKALKKKKKKQEGRNKDKKKKKRKKHKKEKKHHSSDSESEKKSKKKHRSRDVSSSSSESESGRSATHSPHARKDSWKLVSSGEAHGRGSHRVSLQNATSVKKTHYLESEASKSAVGTSRHGKTEVHRTISFPDVGKKRHSSSSSPDYGKKSHPRSPSSSPSHGKKRPPRSSSSSPERGKKRHGSSSSSTERGKKRHGSSSSSPERGKKRHHGSPPGPEHGKKRCQRKSRSLSPDCQKKKHYSALPSSPHYGKKEHHRTELSPDHRQQKHHSFTLSSPDHGKKRYFRSPASLNAKHERSRQRSASSSPDHRKKIYFRSPS